MSQKKFFAPPDPTFYPPSPPRYQLCTHLTYWYDIIYSKEEIWVMKVWKKLPLNTGPPGGVKRGVRGVTHSFFDLFSKNWPFLKSASPCDSNGINGFVLYSFRFKKKINFPFWFKIWDLAKKTHFSSFLSKKAKNANFFYNRLIYI